MFNDSRVRINTTVNNFYAVLQVLVTLLSGKLVQKFLSKKPDTA